mgnify:CR=1 FL=1
MSQPISFRETGEEIFSIKARRLIKDREIFQRVIPLIFSLAVDNMNEQRMSIYFYLLSLLGNSKPLFNYLNRH